MKNCGELKAVVQENQMQFGGRIGMLLRIIGSTCYYLDHSSWQVIVGEKEPQAMQTAARGNY